jgi:hypothetical protein
MSTQDTAVGAPKRRGLVELGHPARRLTYELTEVGSPTLVEVLAPYLDKWYRGRRGVS